MLFRSPSTFSVDKLSLETVPPGLDLRAQFFIFSAEVNASYLGDSTIGILPTAAIARKAWESHGAVIVGPNLQVTVRDAIYTEVNAKMQLAALSLGGPVTYVSPEEGTAVLKNPGDTARGWELWKRKAMGQ